MDNRIIEFYVLWDIEDNNIVPKVYFSLDDAKKATENSDIKYKLMRHFYDVLRQQII